jgi:hypothetical protein
MGRRGPRPKLVRSSESKTRAREAEFIDVANDGVIRGPELPDGEWPERTLAWWDTWRRSAMAQEFTDTDWDYLIDTALIHRELWTGNVKAAGELRLRVQRFGATVPDRERLRLRIDMEAEQADRRPSMTKDRRQRLLRAVEKGQGIDT